MALEIFNSLSREKEIFEPINQLHVGMYTCGPTVYNYPHIGNYRAYVFGDMLKRYLKYKGYDVKHVMNITDIDDKTIRDSQLENKSLKEFTEFYTEEFFKDRDLLNIIPADTYTKATDYVVEMIELIEKLIEKGYAYKTDDGSIYFDISKDAEYGKLSHLNLSELKDNAKGRLKNDEYDKENAQDFALWKSWDKNDGDVFWEPNKLLGRESELAKGRPGWHIECSAMSIKTLGESFDIHTGGVDNMFPHHENEIAQSECATGKMFSKYFMHNEHLLVDGVKMSKSAGNFYTLRDLINKDINPIAFRLWLYGSHYKTRTNFTLEVVMGAERAYKRLCDTYLSLPDGGNVIASYKNDLMSFMDDDLNTPKALALLWDLTHDTDISYADKKATLLDFDKVFGFGLDKITEDVIPENILQIARERNEARMNKDWVRSDELRKEINLLGYEVKDTEFGFKINKI